MFCYQCEQTSKGTGCTSIGVCGKDSSTAALQDLLVHLTKGLAMYAHRARQLDATKGADRSVDVAMIEALFTSVTNVAFDAERVAQVIGRTVEARARARALYEQLCRAAGREPEQLGGAASAQPAIGVQAMARQGEEHSIAALRKRIGEDRAGLHELVVYGSRARPPTLTMLTCLVTTMTGPMRSSTKRSMP